MKNFVGFCFLFGIFTLPNTIWAKCIIEQIYLNDKYVTCKIQIDGILARTFDSSILSFEKCSSYCEDYFKNIPTEQYTPKMAFDTNLSLAALSLGIAQFSEATQLGEGAWGQIFGNDSLVVKVPEPNVFYLAFQRLKLGFDTETPLDSTCQSFQNEIKMKSEFKRAFEVIRDKLPLSPLIFVDPGDYFDTFHNGVRSCWIVMNRIYLNNATQLKWINRSSTLYQGDLTEELKQRVTAVAQLYAIHLLGAHQTLPVDLELAVGSVKTETQNLQEVVSLIDYGYVGKALTDDSPYYEEELSVTVNRLLKNIPHPHKDREKFELFSVHFLEVAKFFEEEKLADRILELLQKAQ